MHALCMHALVQGVVLNISVVCTWKHTADRLNDSHSSSTCCQASTLRWRCIVPDQQQLADVMKEVNSWRFAFGPARLL